MKYTNEIHKWISKTKLYSIHKRFLSLVLLHNESKQLLFKQSLIEMYLL